MLSRVHRDHHPQSVRSTLHNTFSNPGRYPSMTPDFHDIILRLHPMSESSCLRRFMCLSVSCMIKRNDFNLIRLHLRINPLLWHHRRRSISRTGSSLAYIYMCEIIFAQFKEIACSTRIVVRDSRKIQFFGSRYSDSLAPGVLCDEAISTPILQ